MNRNNLVTNFSVVFTLGHRMGCVLKEISLSIAYVSLRYLTNTIIVKNEYVHEILTGQRSTDVLIY